MSLTVFFFNRNFFSNSQKLKLIWYDWLLFLSNSINPDQLICIDVFSGIFSVKFLHLFTEIFIQHFIDLFYTLLLKPLNKKVLYFKATGVLFLQNLILPFICKLELYKKFFFQHEILFTLKIKSV